MKQKPEQLEFPNGRSKILPDGSELPDPRPMALPVGFERPPSIQELIRQLVTDPQIREELRASDAESFDEADDFDIEDDLPVNSPHEDQFDPLHLLAREQEIMSGTVKPRSREELEQAEETLKKHRKPAKSEPVDTAEKKE